MKLEPVAWHVKDKTDFFTMWKPIARQWILDGFDVVEMFPATPEGYVVVPKEPTEAMWGELARDIMFVLRQERPTPKKLLYHLSHLYEELPDWLLAESELRDPQSDHVISKGTCCVLIYKAMIAAGEQ